MDLIENKGAAFKHRNKYLKDTGWDKQQYQNSSRIKTITTTIRLRAGSSNQSVFSSKIRRQQAWVIQPSSSVSSDEGIRRDAKGEERRQHSGGARKSQLYYPIRTNVNRAEECRWFQPITGAETWLWSGECDALGLACQARRGWSWMIGWGSPSCISHGMMSHLI